MPDIIINYWNLNSVYVIITVLVFMMFFVVNYILFNRFQFVLSKELNADCKNPLAVYFHKDERDRCLSDKIMKNTEMRVPVISYETKVKRLNDTIAKTNQRMVDVSNNFEKSKVAPELAKVDTAVTDVSNAYYTTLYKKYEDITNNTGTMINGIVENGNKIAGFKDTINDNIVKLISVGNLLLNKIIQKIPLDKKWYKGLEVKTFNNITKYLNTTSDPNINVNVNPEVQQNVTNAISNYQTKMNPYSTRMNSWANIKDYDPKKPAKKKQTVGTFLKNLFKKKKKK